MKLGALLVVLSLLMSSGISHGKEDRWNNFAEDTDLKYYLDDKSVVSLNESVCLVWVKSVAKDKGYFKREYNVPNLSYILTNYEIDCASSTYRVRGTIMFDKNRREIVKNITDGAGYLFEPVPPESVLELVQDEVCVAAESADLPDLEEPSALPPVEVVVPLGAARYDELPSLQ